MNNYNGNLHGYIHSVYTGGMVDGPGVRYIVFFAGCNLRCKYCHNPDTWNMLNARLHSVDEVIGEIKKYESYLKFSGGGVTITGGEPFVQPEFLTELLKACKSKGWHTTLDTSGNAPAKIVDDVLKYTDLLLLDIKSINPETYKKLTSASLDRTLNLLKASERLNIPVWIRHVLVPGWTDNLEDLQKMADFLRAPAFPNVEKVKVLPFHQLGKDKWKQMGIPYELEYVEPPSEEVMEKAREILESTRPR